MRIATFVCFTLAGACVIGCGSGTATVRGKVTYKDKPVPNGTVLFVPAKGPPATGNIEPDGTYTLTTILGKHNVTIHALEDTSKRAPEERNPLPPSIIPPKYEREATSGLSADVKAGENTFNFDLK